MDFMFSTSCWFLCVCQYQRMLFIKETITSNYGTIQIFLQCSEFIQVGWYCNGDGYDSEWSESSCGGVWHMQKLRSPLLRVSSRIAVCHHMFSLLGHRGLTVASTLVPFVYEDIGEARIKQLADCCTASWDVRMYCQNREAMKLVVRRHYHN